MILFLLKVFERKLHDLAQGAPSAPQAAAPAAPGGGGSQQDYSAEWASYYRSIGKNDEADAIEKQIANRVRILET